MSQGCAAGGRRHDRQGLPLPGRRPGQGRSLRQLRVLPPRLSRVLNLHGKPEGGAVIQAEARSTVLTGQHFMNGDIACAEGALAAGCPFFAGYPITPSTEIAERLAQRMPRLGSCYVQMEDELAS